MLNFPLGYIKKTCLLRDGNPPVVIDLEKEVCLQVNPIMYQILSQYSRCKFNDILEGLRVNYTWSAIEAAVFRLVELAELGVIFTTAENRGAIEPLSGSQFVVSPGFIRNLQSRSLLSNAAYYALLNNLSQHTNLSVLVPESPDSSEKQDMDEIEGGTYPFIEKISYTPHFSYAAVANLPLSCDAIVMFAPLHEEDLQFLKRCKVPILLFISDYSGSNSTFNNLSPAYSRLKDTDLWFCPYFWLESKLRGTFSDLHCFEPMPLGVDPRLIRSLPEKTELKGSLSQALENDNFNNTPAIGVFGSDGDWLANHLAENDIKHLYLCIAGGQRTLGQHHSFIIEDVSDIDILPHVLKALDLLIFIARGNVEPYVLSLAAAVGIPTVVVCEEPLPATPYFDRFYHCDRFDVPTLQEIIEDVLENEELSHTVDLDSISWDTTSKRILQLYGDIGAKHVGSQDSVITPPRPPEYLFAKFYDPAQKKIGTRCTSLNTFRDVPLDVGFVGEMKQYHTMAEISIILSHLGRKPAEITNLMSNSSDPLNIPSQIRWSK